MNYTRKQLITAQLEWNKDSILNPSEYEEIEGTKDYAEKQIDHLLSLIN